MIGKSKYLCVDCGKRVSGSDHRRCLRCVKLFQRGINASNYKGVDYSCIDCGKKLANMYATRCQSCAKTGIRNNRYGKKAINSKRIYYQSVCFRSYWEANFAKWLDLSRIKWKYESKTFELKNMTYTPDFYLPEFDCYIEIKGFWWKLARLKFRTFKKLYRESIFVLNKKYLQNIGLIR